MRQFAFGRSVITVGVTLALALGAVAARPLYPNNSVGRLAWAGLRVVQGSTPSSQWNDNFTTGYYEELLQGPAKSGGLDTRNPLYRYDIGFRTYEFKPNLNVKDKTEGIVRTNSFGMLDQEYTLAKPKGVQRIAVLGDSFVRGLGVEPGASFEAVLETKLNDSAVHSRQRYELLNFGMNGYRLNQIMDMMLERASPFRPDVYLVCITDVGVFRRWEQHMVKLYKDGQDLKYPFLEETLAKAGLERTDTGAEAHEKLQPYRLPLVRAMLHEMKKRADGEGAHLVVALIPTLEEPWLNRRRLTGIQPLAESEGIPVIDLMDTFDNVADLAALRVQELDLHPNAKGHQMLADKLYRNIISRPELEILGHRPIETTDNEGHNRPSQPATLLSQLQ